MARKNTPAAPPLEGAVTELPLRIDADRVDGLALLLEMLVTQVQQLEQDKNDLAVACQGLDQRVQDQNRALGQLHERVAVLEAKKPGNNGSNGSNGASQADLAPVMGEAQQEHTCTVVGADEKPHGDCRLNRFGHCPKCFAAAAFRKSQAR